MGVSHGRRNLPVSPAAGRLELRGKLVIWPLCKVPRVDFLRGERRAQADDRAGIDDDAGRGRRRGGGAPPCGRTLHRADESKVVNGFGNTVTFLAGSRSLKRFSFGTLGCFGYGTFPVGVDPYSTSLAQLPKAVPVTAKGTFAVTASPASWSGGDSSLKLKVTINGSFTSATAATGTIAISETGGNGGSCGPVKMTFTAQLGNHAA